MLDGYGGAHFVTSPSCDIQQDFYFGNVDKNEFPEGRAVDLEMSTDSLGLWVLTDYGGIYRAGSTKEPSEEALVPNTDRSGVLGFDVPFGDMRDPELVDTLGASLRAVSLVVIDMNGDSRAEGYIILDSQGGRFHLQPDGTSFTGGSFDGFPDNHPFRLLDPEGYVWPFFKGLDIARDMEIHATLEGLVILDGWDGIHPVPVDVESNPVYFANNRVSNADDTPMQTVGMPYVTRGYDDPTTEDEDEGNPDEYGIDSESIFTDLEFSMGCGDGLYTLDKFGGVFVLGAAREIEEEPVPQFGGSPYFFPFLYAEDIEMFGGDETEYAEDETGFDIITIDIPNLPADARPMRLVRIPAGTFQMGSPDTERGRFEDWEGLVHTVTLTNDFYIGETEVTQAQWQAIMGNNPAHGYGVGNDYPVYFVSWNDITQANGFLDRLDAQTSYSGSRLPTEAEWEYACRAGTQTRFYFGDSLGCDDYSPNCAAGLLPGSRSDYMWYDWSDGQNGYPWGAKEVATLLPNQFGLYDMSGNLWEWCEDWFQEDFYSQQGATYLNPLCTNSASGYRVIRGGTWDYRARYCRSAMRYWNRPVSLNNTLGFRVVLPVSSIDR